MTFNLFRICVVCVVVAVAASAQAGSRPNIVLVMADDQGWGQTGYYNHPVLKTPNLDAMAANGLRFDRFYAGCAGLFANSRQRLNGPLERSDRS